MGDVPEIIQELMSRHAAPLTLYARQFFSGGDFAAAEEVVQDVFFRLSRQLVGQMSRQTSRQRETPGMTDNGMMEHVEAWLYRSVRNGAISEARSHRRRRNRENARNAVPFFEQDAETLLDAELVTEKLQTLDRELREIVTLHLWGERSFAEIGKLLGKSKATVFRRYEEALETLRDLLDKKQ
ncbi:MAG: RNA polymerase sigma factor [Planctomycetaceae bacterium]|nr:RNA polymerase sigma factor [Planctomycetaceae bacterium]